MATTICNFSYMDESGEICHVKLNLPAILADGTNWDDVVSGVASNRALMGAALNAILLVEEFKNTVNTLVWADSTPTIPSDQAAQREYVARMTYVDNVTAKKYRFDLPGLDPAHYLAGTDKVDFTTLGMIAFKAAFEANTLSPVGNAVTLLSGKRTGKRA